MLHLARSASGFSVYPPDSTKLAHDSLRAANIEAIRRYTHVTGGAVRYGPAFHASHSSTSSFACSR